MGKWRSRGPLLIVCTMLMVPVSLSAQEAVVTGAVTDATGGTLPGVTVVATHEATGNTFLAVTDLRGVFRIPVRTGDFRVTAELSGFAPVAKDVELLVGQSAVVDLRLVPANVQVGDEGEHAEQSG